MLDTPARVAFLKKSHLFRGLTDKELASVAAIMRERSYDESETIFTEGSGADSFYIVFKERVHLTRQVKNKTIKIATLFEGDYFGERGLLKGTTRTATVKAERGTIVLILYRDDFNSLLKKIPGLLENFDLMIKSRDLAAQLNFRWLTENEVIYFLARKHYFLLIRALVGPTLTAVVGLAFFVAFLSTPFSNSYQFYLLYPVFVFLFIAIAWGVWQYLDWGNDFYIVTNQRAIWLEKVIGLYDSRQETPMNTILSVSTETDYWGRRFDYGTVVVRTFTGQIKMNFVQHPHQAAAMIEEYWNRTKAVVQQNDQDIIKNAIRAKIGIKKPGPPPAPPPPPPPAIQISPVQKFLNDAFALRREDNGVITYHKHWVVLIFDTLLQTGGILLVLAVLLAYPFITKELPPAWLALPLITVISGLAVWWLYEYVDWQNDLYQVTPDQIVDRDKRPFGTEDRKSAPLESILSTENKRNGFIEVLFNYGTVYINVGGAKFDFEDVADPPSVQQDILRRMQLRVQKKREGENAAERERMAEWLAYYHKVSEEIQQEQKQSRPPNSG